MFLAFFIQVMGSPVVFEQSQSGQSVPLRVDNIIAHRKVRTETGVSSVAYPIRISKPLKVKVSTLKLQLREHEGKPFSIVRYKLLFY
jgi:hypothetical protein